MHPYDLPDGARMVLMVGKKSLGKGTPVVLQAAPIVKAACPDVHFVFVGKGDYPIPTSEWLHNVDHVPQEQMRDWYDAATVVCHIPICQDAYPRAVLEAMAYARAVVASRVGGIPEQVVDGVTGLLVPKGDAQAAADALIRALDMDTAIRMGTAGWEHIRTGRNWGAALAHNARARELTRHVPLGRRPWTWWDEVTWHLWTPLFWPWRVA